MSFTHDSITFENVGR